MSCSYPPFKIKTKPAFCSRWRPLQKVTTAQNTENRWPLVPSLNMSTIQFLHLRLRGSEEGGGGQKEEPKDHDVCFEMVPSMYVREAEFMKSQQYGCLIKIWNMLPADTPAWTGGSSQGSNPNKELQLPREGESIFSRDVLPDRLSNPNRNELSGVYVCVTIIIKK